MGDAIRPGGKQNNHPINHLARENPTRQRVGSRDRNSLYYNLAKTQPRSLANLDFVPDNNKKSEKETAVIDTNDEPLVMAAPEPDVAELVDEFTNCSPISDNWNALSTNDDTRFCRWAGQHPDGRKHQELLAPGEEVFPWDKASDVRIPLADEIINEIVAIETVAFFRSLLRAGAVEAGDIEASAYATKLLKWLMGTKQYKSLVREVELHSQYTHTYGWSVLHVTWQQEHLLRLAKITMAQLMELAQQAAQPGQPGTS